MNPTFRKVALAAASLGLLVSLYAALRPRDDDDSASATTRAATTAATTEPAPSERTIRVVVRGGKPVGGILRASLGKGDRAVLAVTADVADEVHLHGYDLSADVGPGKPVRIAFTAAVPGRFEVELEDSGVQIAELEVRP